MLKIGWGELLPGYEKYPPCFQSVVPYLFASIVYHVGFLRSTLDCHHPIFQTTIFTRGYVKQFEDRIQLFELKSGYCNMMATGVPHSIITLHELNEIKKEQAAQRLEMQNMKSE